MSPFMEDPLSLVAVVALTLTPEPLDRMESCEVSEARERRQWWVWVVYDSVGGMREGVGRR